LTAALLISLPGFGQGYDLSDPTEPWKHADSGKGTEVPVPFEPLTTDGTSVSMWGRKHELGNLLSKQMTNQDKPIFPAPPTVSLSVGSDRYEFNGGSPKVSLSRPDRVEFTGTRLT